MTEDELAAFVLKTRATVDAELAKYDALDWDVMPPDVRAEMEAVRDSYRELRAQLTAEAIEAELEATIHAGRELTPAEARGLVRKQ